MAMRICRLGQLPEDQLGWQIILVNRGRIHRILACGLPLPNIDGLILHSIIRVDQERTQFVKHL